LECVDRSERGLELFNRANDNTVDATTLLCNAPRVPVGRLIRKGSAG